MRAYWYLICFFMSFATREMNACAQEETEVVSAKYVGFGYTKFQSLRLMGAAALVERGRWFTFGIAADIPFKAEPDTGENSTSTSVVTWNTNIYRPAQLGMMLSFRMSRFARLTAVVGGEVPNAPGLTDYYVHARLSLDLQFWRLMLHGAGDISSSGYSYEALLLVKVVEHFYLGALYDRENGAGPLTRLDFRIGAALFDIRLGWLFLRFEHDPREIGNDRDAFVPLGLFATVAMYF